ncbi:MAG: 50S ribosomal protein L5 [bacterium]
MNGVKEKQSKTFETIKGALGITNVMETPKLVKVVLSSGIGSVKDKKKIELIADRMNRIAGQKVVVKTAKKSIATFKSREGDPAGYQVTLRGDRMVNFLNKLINIALPRTKDFRGIARKAIDEMGNINIGIREHTIFPETSDEELKDVFGFAATIVTTAKDAKSAEIFFEYLGIPFMKPEEEKKLAAKGRKSKE